NLDVECLFPDEEQLKNIKYRYKKELYGAIRLVDIKGIDICACCAPHVANTGEIGIIKLLDFERVRSGVRIIMKCGSFALNDYRIKYYNIREISNLLSSKQDSAADAVGALNKKLSSEQQKVALLKRRYIDGIIKSANIDNRVVFEDDLDMKEVQLLADGLHKKLNVLSAAFSKCDDGYLFAICSECKELDAFFADFKSNLALKGGGRNGMVQGTVFADESKIRLFFSL
ncbi:MAG: hypothetical protein J6J13_01765, partial [Clostridia bacterium]|nr:hypothetical protein [Clostridia bacterium]